MIYAGTNNSLETFTNSLIYDYPRRSKQLKEALIVEGGADFCKSNLAISAIVDTEPGEKITFASIYGYRIPVVITPLRPVLSPAGRGLCQ